MAIQTIQPDAFQAAQSLTNSAILAIRALVASECARHEFTISLAGFVGNEAGNHDRQTAAHAMAEIRNLLAWQAYCGATPEETPSKNRARAGNEARALMESETARAHECRLALALQKRRAIREANGLPSVTDSKLGMAGLGNRQKVASHEFERITRATLASADSPALAKVAATIIRRINYPKALCGKVTLYKRDSKLGKAGSVTQAEREKSLNAKARAILSQDDECEVFQTCALVMTARGILQSPSLTGEDWKALFRETRAALGIDRMRAGEISTAPDDAIFTLAESVRSGHDGEAVALARVKLARRLRYWNACISKACEVSSNRKRKGIARNCRATLRKIAAGNLTFSGMSQLEMQIASKAKSKLVAEVAAGESAFDREAQAEAQETQDKRQRARALSLEASMLALW